MLRALTISILLLCHLGCAVPPDYPPNEEHVGVDAEICYDCHVAKSGPKPHPSHFEDDGSFKSKRRNCHNCHEPEPPSATSDSTGEGGAG